MRMSWQIVVSALVLLMVGCTAEETMEKKVVLPEDAPDFVKVEDIEAIDWDRTASEFGDRGMIGNEGKTGIIGADMPVLEGQKWMWHLWDVSPGEEMTVVGVHKDTKSVEKVLTNPSKETYWSLELAGPNNGADVHRPSNVRVSKEGKWAFLVYVNGELHDVVVKEV
ncbi:hypothetical protein ACSVDE_17275 [Pseudalkalibacillus sp. Hm43]|uniref:hypothetical protein n=1 Tax=Pseudalkalibacillus sp. Hm43 TaxID=3450742 RepID=UPI003F4401F1